MKVSRLLSIIVVGLSGALFLAATAQEVGPQIETPNTASVSAGASQQLVPGQAFSFQLRFDRAPDGYGGGEIRYVFRKIGSDSLPFPHRFSPFDQTAARGAAELHDGQAIYTLSLPISGEMSPGTWKLAEVTLGRSVQKPVSIPENITFEVPHISPAVVRVHAPGSARAGGRFTIKITLAKYPDFLGMDCVLRLSGSLNPLMPNGQPGPDAYSVALSSIELSPNQHAYEISGTFISDLPAGPWQGQLSISAVPRIGQMIRLGGVCRSPQLEGDPRFTFTVEPAMTLVTPTSVTVTVNPSQIQLLLGEADRLKAKAQHISEQLTSENRTANQVLLQNSLQEAATDLDKTEEAYKQQGLDQSSTRPVNIFFDDIRFNYGEALKALTSQSALGPQVGPRLERVDAALGKLSPRLNPASRAVLASILHNAKAYDVVASSKSVTFNLDVFSEPKGAAVSYRLRGGEYRTLDHETDWRIENLTRAVYLIKLQKPGYEDKEVTFDAIDSTSTSVDVRLERKRGTR